ncbi:MAG: leucine-rich repeat protein [Oscillospiraceae bacterium]|nr:leucine-rich repeat protein [Oscillospiraceae bacterium]
MIAWRGYYAKTTATAYNLVNKRLVEVADFDTDNDGFSDYAGNGNHNLTVGDVDGDGCDEIICGALALDNDFSVLWCSGRGHGDALHLADYDPVHEGMEYFSVHESSPYGMTLYDASTGEEIFHLDADGDTGRGMMANVGYTDGYFEFWGAGNYASYGDENVTNVEKYTPDSTNFRIFWDGNIYDELLDGTGGSDSGSQIKISGKDGRISSFRNVVTNNGTKNNPGLTADLFGDWREEVVARGTDNESLIVYTTVIETENKLYTLMHDRAYRMQVASQNAGYNQPPHISYYVNDENDEFDERETAAYVKTVHNGETAVRTANLPDIFGYSISAANGTVNIKNRIGEEISAVLYTASYNADKTLSKVSMEQIEIPADGYSGAISAEDGGTVYLWSEEQEPLAAKAVIGAETPSATEKPMPTASPTPTTKPTATPIAASTTAPTAAPTLSPEEEFVVEDGVLTEYNGTSVNVTVPETVDGQTVTTIGDRAFRYNEDIESVTLPDTVTIIYSYAFCGCTSLAEISLSDAVTAIGNYAFSECSSLKEITLPSALTKISNYMLEYCSSLESIALPDTITAIGDGAFSSCSSLKEITLPSTITALSSHLLEDCVSLEEISLPSSVTTINNAAFAGCESLTKIDLSNVTSIGASAFYECTGLEEVTYGKEKTSIGRSAFSGCDNVKKVTVPNMETSLGVPANDTLTVYGYTHSKAYITAGIDNVTFYDLETGEPADMTWIADTDGVLYKYNGTKTDVTVPETIDGITITEIDADAFSASGITSIILPDTVTSVYYYAFDECAALKSVTLSSGMTSLFDIFTGCTALERVYIPSSITTIEDGIFADCPNVAIYGIAGSAAATYATDNDITFYDIESEEPTA